MKHKKYSDPGTIPKEELCFYEPDDYYQRNPGALFGHPPVIDYDERIKAEPRSKEGLFAPEIVAIAMCKWSPNTTEPRHYPGYYWFKYGIRDVGGFQRSLEERGFIQKDATKNEILRWVPTKKGEKAVENNPAVLWAHRHSNDFDIGDMDAWVALRLFDKTNWEEQMLEYMEKLRSEADYAGKIRNMTFTIAKFAYENEWYDLAEKFINEVVSIDKNGSEFEEFPDKTPPGIVELRNKIIKKLKKEIKDEK